MKDEEGYWTNPPIDSSTVSVAASVALISILINLGWALGCTIPVLCPGRGQAQSWLLVPCANKTTLPAESWLETGSILHCWHLPLCLRHIEVTNGNEVKVTSRSHDFCSLPLTGS
ncbi:hypothetical protein JZ751_017486 [Albula glossodonta]|uniref:Uncharacterized protein n=1 Tax=Albula glossodonta TaxID=121402 RepID=A0A8T2PKZ5_9TELE|nr:hypothetical protein JZ751_017486 [Albula glossodonta]